MIIDKEYKHNITYGGAVIRTYHVNKGEGISAHTHSYNHATSCHAGCCVVRVEGKELIMTKDTQPVNLIGGKWHEIEALEDGTVFVNIFAEGKY